MVNDAGVRAQLRRSLGFCKYHTRLLLDTQLRDPLGLTIIYQDILSQILDDFPDMVLPADSTGALNALMGRFPKSLTSQVEGALQALSARESCPACQQRDKYAQGIVQSLIKNLQDEALVRALEASSGLCLPHIRLALINIQSSDQFNKLGLISRQKFQELRAELLEFIRRSDYRFGKEAFGAEGNAYIRVAEMFVGTE
jgi:hypothetical protein